jgi:hypothetical protein
MVQNEVGIGIMIASKKISALIIFAFGTGDGYAGDIPFLRQDFPCVRASWGCAG